jgi:hypothetical protein
MKKQGNNIMSMFKGGDKQSKTKSQKVEETKDSDGIIYFNT